MRRSFYGTFERHEQCVHYRHIQTRCQEWTLLETALWLHLAPVMVLCEFSEHEGLE